MKEHKKVNVLEKRESEEIVSYIEQYETENNIEVKYITDVLILSYPYRLFYQEIKNNSILVISGVKSIENYRIN